MTRSVDDLSWLCSKTIGRSINPNSFVYGEWDSQRYEKAKKQKFRVGYMIEDHEMKAAPAIKNGIKETIEIL